MKSLAINLSALFVCATLSVACVSEPSVDSAAPSVDSAVETQLVDPAHAALAAELVGGAEATALRSFLEEQGYRADFENVQLTDEENGMANLVLNFKSPTVESRNAALVFHVQSTNDAQSVAAMTIDSDESQRFYIVQGGKVRDTQDLNAPTNGTTKPGLNSQAVSNPQQETCDWWVPYGCGECRWASIICATKNKPGYFWGIKWGTCGTCNASNENGCC